MSDLAEISESLAKLPPEELEKLQETFAKSRPVWFPTAGPQFDAYYSKADILLYGGSGGSGKTDLGLGLAFTAHQRSLILRRQYTDLSGITERAVEINGSRDGFSGAIPPKLRTRDGRLIQFGAHKDLGDEQSWQGVPFDYKYIDEAVSHLEQQVKFHLGWVRSAAPGQRCRTVLGTNPPIDASGDWIIGMFRPWLDMTYDKPAKHGELRWFITTPDGEDLEVDGPEPREYEVKGKIEKYEPKSRTFIPGRLRDNPFLISTGYQATLDALPEPLRTAVRDGNFMATRVDADWQVIPTEWVQLAQGRWTKDGKRGKRMKSLAYDPAGGGKDAAELSMRYDNWYDEIVSTKGAETADGSLTVALIFKYRRDGAGIVLDVGGGWAGQTTLRLKDNETEFVAFNGTSEATGRDRSGKLKFTNKRAQAWWSFREELDPDQPGGSDVALPPDPILLGDLTAPTYSIAKSGILIESKPEIRKRLGRSTGRGDAVVMNNLEGNVLAIRAHYNAGRKQLPKRAVTTRNGPLQRHRG